MIKTLQSKVERRAVVGYMGVHNDRQFDVDSCLAARRRRW